MRLEVRVQPGAKRDALLARLADGTWKVAVAAPAQEGRANEAVVRLLSRLLGVPRRQVVVARGASARGKWIDVEGLSEAEAHARLAAALAEARRKDEGERRGE